MQCNGRGESKVRSRLTLVDQLQFVKIRYPGLGQLAQASESENANAYGNENANVNVTGTAIGTMTGTTGTTKTDAGSVEKTRISMEMSAARGSDLTKVLKNRLSQPRHPPPACLHLHRLSLTARVAELDLANPTVGTATGRLGVLATRGMTLTSLLAFASGSVAVH